LGICQRAKFASHVKDIRVLMIFKKIALSIAIALPSAWLLFLLHKNLALPWWSLMVILFSIACFYWYKQFKTWQKIEQDHEDDFSIRWVSIFSAIVLFAGYGFFYFLVANIKHNFYKEVTVIYAIMSVVVFLLAYLVYLWQQPIIKIILLALLRTVTVASSLFLLYWILANSVK
jgi:hypothetical protein